MMQAFRKAIGVRIREETEVIEGEVRAQQLPKDDDTAAAWTPGLLCHAQVLHAVRAAAYFQLLFFVLVNSWDTTACQEWT